MNVIFHTLGCKVNQYETEVIKDILIKRGHTASEDKVADAIVINSCTVTAESDRKTRQIVRKYRRENPNAVIVLTGCMAQAFPEKSAELIEADIVMGNTDTERLVSLTEEFFKNRQRIVSVDSHFTGEKYNTPGISAFSERTRAFMKIEDGCDRFCSYCIIPYARGRVRSRGLDEIRSETARLAENGYSEIVLVGINLSAYGKEESYDICDAVSAVCENEKIKRVRLGSLEPDHISDSMLERLKGEEKFCPQFHLSLQSGCDETLKRMNRHYDSAFYFDLVSRIRKSFPDSAITTDIMVGFAGESEEEFNKSLDFVKKVGFARAHIFCYSRRSGTVADRFADQLQNSEKESRSKAMTEAAGKSEQEFLSRQIGKAYPVLFEACENCVAEGYTPNYSRVLVKTALDLSGEIKNVKLIAAEKDYCLGEIV